MTAGLMWAPLTRPTGERAIAAPKTAEHETRQRSSQRHARDPTRDLTAFAEHQDHERQAGQHQQAGADQLGDEQFPGERQFAPLIHVRLEFAARNLGLDPAGARARIPLNSNTWYCHGSMSR